MNKIFLDKSEPMSRVEISRNDPCPCGSARKYKNCCIEKKLVWYKKSNGEYTPGRIIDNEFAINMLSSALESQENRFEKLFGRKMTDEDPIIFDQDSYSPEDTWNNIAQAMEELGIDPSIIYATKKTKMIASSFNEDLMTGKQIDEWNNAIDEYYKIVTKTKKNESIFLDLYSEIESIIVLLGTIISNAGQLKRSLEEFTSCSKDEFILFCITKSLKTIKAIRQNIDMGLIEDALSLIRTLYENYIYITYSVNEPQKIQEYLIAKIGISRGTHEYEKGKRKVIDKKTNSELKGYLTAYEMASSSKYSEDTDIFKYIYPHLSAYTHPDIGSISNYISDSRFNATIISNSSDESIFWTAYFAVLILYSSISLNNISTAKRTDIINVSKRIIKKLKECLNGPNLDINDKSIMISLFDRIDKIDFNI